MTGNSSDFVVIHFIHHLWDHCGADASGVHDVAEAGLEDGLDLVVDGPVAGAKHGHLTCIVSQHQKLSTGQISED